MKLTMSSCLPILSDPLSMIRARFFARELQCFMRQSRLHSFLNRRIYFADLTAYAIVDSCYVDDILFGGFDKLGAEPGGLLKNS